MVSNSIPGDFMIRLAVLAATLVLTAGSTMAEETAAYSGLYLGSGEGELSADLTHIDGDRYDISISTIVPMENNVPGCGGGIDGEIEIKDGAGMLTAPNELYDVTSTLPAFSKPMCEVSLQFDDNYGLIIKEEGGCTYYHGAACGFSGTLEHEAAGI